MVKQKKEDKKKFKFQLGFNRKTGIFLIILGVAFQFLNIITYGIWEIDIDIFGVLILLVGIIFTIIFWKKNK